MIHPTAVIDAAAELAPDVDIGPYVVINGAVRLGGGCRVQAHAVITGAVTMGEGNLIGYGAVIGADPQDLGLKAGLQSGVSIGSRNVIREYCTIHRATKENRFTTVGNDNFLMAGVHLAHDVQL